jgi:hypothetical protein
MPLAPFGSAAANRPDSASSHPMSPGALASFTSGGSPEYDTAVVKVAPLAMAVAGVTISSSPSRSVAAAAPSTVAAVIS